MDNTIPNNILVALGGLSFLREKNSTPKVIDERTLQLDFPIEGKVNRVVIHANPHAAYDMRFIEEANGIERASCAVTNVYSDDLLFLIKRHAPDV